LIASEEVSSSDSDWITLSALESGSNRDVLATFLFLATGNPQFSGEKIGQRPLNGFI